ncbi:MAG: glyoxalase [Saprospiraceae bacterium]
MRDTDLIALRPPIPTIIDKNAVNPAELFQNRTLRPILKLQNDLLDAIFKNYIIKRKGVFHKLGKPKRVEYIENSIRKDLKFKNLLVGVITGQFTLEEWALFIADERELTKRTTNLLVQRLTSQVEVFSV